MSAARDPEVQALLDKQALRELALRYARGIDRRDRGLLLSVYHPDAMDDHGEMFRGSPERFADWQPEVMGPFEVTAHYIMNSDYCIDGDEAEGELYFIAFHRVKPPEAAEFWVGGRYLDRYQRRDGGWKIAHRRLVWDFVHQGGENAEAVAFLRGLGVCGSGEDDLSYGFLPRLAAR